MIEPELVVNTDQFALKITKTDEAVNEIPTARNSVDEELAAICEKEKVYMESKMNAYARIQEEENYMTRFIKAKCDELREDVDTSAMKFKTNIGDYKKNLNLLRYQNYVTDETQFKNELKALKDKYGEGLKSTEIEVKFERNLSLHFIQTIGYVTEIGQADVEEETYVKRAQENVLFRRQELTVLKDEKSNSSKEHGSSYAEVLEVPSLLDDTDASISSNDYNENEMSDDVVTGQREIETITAKQIPALQQIKMRDIAVSTEQRLVGLLEKANRLNLVILETDKLTEVSRITITNENSNKIEVINDNQVAVISPDLKPVLIIYLLGSTTYCDWECEFDKCTIVSHDDALYILCGGGHLHVYNISTFKHDMYNLSGTQRNQTWRPKCAVVSENGTSLFISDIDNVYCYKHFPQKREQRMQWTYIDEVEGCDYIDRQLYLGMSVFDQQVVLLDKNNNSLIKITSEGGLYRGTISSSSFGDCDLVAFDRRNCQVHLISYRYNEYKVVQIVSHTEDDGAESEEKFDPYTLTE